MSESGFVQILHRECFRLFLDEMFATMSAAGPCAMIVAVVMVLI